MFSMIAELANSHKFSQRSYRNLKVLNDALPCTGYEFLGSIGATLGGMISKCEITALNEPCKCSSAVRFPSTVVILPRIWMRKPLSSVFP
jgi:hypothetical protein